MTHHRSSHRRRSAFLLSTLGIALVASLTGNAAAGGVDDKAARKAAEMTALRSAVARKQITPLPRIMTIALAKVPGDVVKTELETKNGKFIYEVKILTATGRVREVKLDARTGAIFAIEDD